MSFWFGPEASGFALYHAGHQFFLFFVFFFVNLFLRFVFLSLFLVFFVVFGYKFSLFSFSPFNHFTVSFRFEL